MQTGLQGKVALITGASRGIGKAVAGALAQEGVRLALCARDERELKVAADEIQALTHSDIIAVKANTTRLNDIRRFVSAAAKKFGRIDILVNNAGGMHVGGIFDSSDEAWENEIQLKLFGYIRMAREVAKFMKVNGGGRIINIAGATGREPDPGFMIPGVMNAAILNFTRALSKELEIHRICVNSVNPDLVDTSLADEAFHTLGEAAQKPPEEIRQSAIQSRSGGRMTSPEEIAQVVVFLASGAAASINGVSLTIDAGRSSAVC